MPQSPRYVPRSYVVGRGAGQDFGGPNPQGQIEVRVRPQLSWRVPGPAGARVTDLERSRLAAAVLQHHLVFALRTELQEQNRPLSWFSARVGVRPQRMNELVHGRVPMQAADLGGAVLLGVGALPDLGEVVREVRHTLTRPPTPQRRPPLPPLPGSRGFEMGDRSSSRPRELDPLVEPPLTARQQERLAAIDAVLRPALTQYVLDQLKASPLLTTRQKARLSAPREVDIYLSERPGLVGGIALLLQRPPPVSIAVCADWLEQVHNPGHMLVGGVLVAHVNRRDEQGRPVDVLALVYDGRDPEDPLLLVQPAEITWNGDTATVVADMGPRVWT